MAHRMSEVFAQEMGQDALASILRASPAPISPMKSLPGCRPPRWLRRYRTEQMASSVTQEALTSSVFRVYTST